MMIAIIDYGAGNIKSLQFALERLQIPSILTSDKQKIEQADALILPGVGSFYDAMDKLNEKQLDTVIKKEVQNGKPLLGICLGMQMLFETSTEGGNSQGLGLLKGKIDIIPNTVKVPHMGWNLLNIQLEQPIVQKLPKRPFVYFVHSYYAQSTEPTNVIANTDYDVSIPAIVQQDNIIGIQFHPEKSGEAGLQILRNFGGIIS